MRVFFFVDVAERERGEIGRGLLAAAPRAPKRDRIMKLWRDRLVQIVKSEDGPTAVEYAVMLALIVVVCITAITTLGSNSNAVFNNVALNTAASS